MKYLLVLLLLLAGCSTAPITAKFPDAPDSLLKPCAPLTALNPQPLLSEVAKTVASNYTEYHLCANKVSTWQQWYLEQKSIYESLK